MANQSVVFFLTVILITFSRADSKLPVSIVIVSPQEGDVLPSCIELDISISWNANTFQFEPSAYDFHMVVDGVVLYTASFAVKKYSLCELPLGLHYLQLRLYFKSNVTLIGTLFCLLSCPTE